jgi:hypothetical protein
MVLIAVTCPYCPSDHITKRGKTDTGKQRYRCQNPDCPHHSFLLKQPKKGVHLRSKSRLSTWHSTVVPSVVPHKCWASASTRY